MIKIEVICFDGKMLERYWYDDVSILKAINWTLQDEKVIQMNMSNKIESIRVVKGDK